jgi:hypothetical protein
MQINAVYAPCHAVHSRRSIMFDPLIRFGEKINAYVVEQ